MARITVEDCIDKVDNRFDLILLAAHRARELSVGASATLDVDDEKMSVVALREIAAENIHADDLKGSLVRTMQTFVERDTSSENDASSVSDTTADTAPENPLEAPMDMEAYANGGAGADASQPSDTSSADDAALAALNAMFEDASEEEIED